MRHYFYSFITFFIALFFILLGIIGILLPWFPAMRIAVINFLNDNSRLTFLFGSSFLAIGIAIILNILFSARGSHYTLKIKKSPVSIHPELLQNQLQEFLKELIPDQEIPCRLQLKRNQIYVTLDFPYVEPAEQKNLLEQIGNELKNFFFSILNYQDPLHLSASFKSSPQ